MKYRQIYERCSSVSTG